MSFDFFNDDENTTAQNGVERNPAPVVAVTTEEKKPKKKWWKALIAALLAALLFSSGFLVCWATLDPEIRTIIGVKKKIQKEYYQEVTDEEFYDAVFDGINAYLDPYSGYLTADEYAANLSDMEGNREGVGLVFSSAGDGLRVARVCGNSPAEAAGILAGERVVGIGKTADETTGCENFAALSAALKTYAADEEFSLRVENGAGVARVVKAKKTAYVENDVFYRTATAAYSFLESERKEQGNPMSYLPDDAAYVRLVQFSDSRKTGKEFAGAMEQFKTDGKKHLVLDLRGNGGGYLDTMQSIASYFCKTATAARPRVVVADYGEKQVAYYAAGNVYGEYFQTDSRIYVLADSGSASASECLLGAMLDYEAISYERICLSERAGVAKTYGKGIMQQTFPLHLLGQDAIKLTTAEIRWPVSNASIHGRGILPEDGTMTVAENYDFEEETKAAIAKCFS